MRYLHKIPDKETYAKNSSNDNVQKKGAHSAGSWIIDKVSCSIPFLNEPKLVLKENAHVASHMLDKKLEASFFQVFVSTWEVFCLSFMKSGWTRL